MLTTEQEQIVQRIKDIGKVSAGITVESSRGLPRKGLLCSRTDVLCI